MGLVNCKECKKEVSDRAKTCPNCGIKNPGIGVKQQAGGCLFIIIIAAVLFMWMGLGDDAPADKAQASPVTSKQKVEQSVNWYEGGTLYKENAIAWQSASYKNKLATCAGFIAKLWKDKKFTPEIQGQISSIHDMRPFADSLVIELDAAFKPAETIEENEMRYTNQIVSDTTVLLLTMKGWI